MNKIIDHSMWIGRLKSSPRLSKRGEYNDGKAPSVYPTSYGPTKASHMKNLEVHSQPGSPCHPRLAKRGVIYGQGYKY